MTMKLRKIPMFGEGVVSKSRYVTAQRRINCYYETRPDGDKSKVVVYGTPGLELSATLSNTVRGFIANSSMLFAVCSGSFNVYNTDLTPHYHSAISSTSGNVSFSFNPTQVMMVDGTAGYIYASGALTVITDGNFPNGCQTVTFLQSFFIVEEPGTSNFWVSSSGDGTTWNGLGFGAAAQYPDNLLAVDSISGLLVLFCQNHMEFWQNIGTSPQPFQYITGSANEIGLSAIWSRVHVGDSIFFLGVTRQNGLQVFRLSGYTVSVVSTSDIDNIIQNFPSGKGSSAVGLSYQTDNHKFYQITFPGQSRSLLFDIATGGWYETQTGVSTNYSQRHIGNFSAYFNRQMLISDYQNGNLYTMNPNKYTDNGNTIVREINTRHAQDNFNRFRLSSIYLDMEVGQGNDTTPNPQLMMQVSKDNGHTWGQERWVSLGSTGQYKTRAIWRRICQSRDVVVKFRMTDPVPFVITSGAAVITERK